MHRKLNIQVEPMEVRVALHPFLAGMSRVHLALLTDCAVSAEFDPGEIILREGETGGGGRRCDVVRTGFGGLPVIQWRTSTRRALRRNVVPRRGGLEIGAAALINIIYLQTTPLTAPDS